MSEFLASIDLIVDNVRTYFTDDGAVARSYINKACQLQDFAMTRVCSFNRATAKLCEDIVKKRKAMPSKQKNPQSPRPFSPSQMSGRMTRSRMRSLSPGRNHVAFASAEQVVQEMLLDEPRERVEETNLNESQQGKDKEDAAQEAPGSSESIVDDNGRDEMALPEDDTNMVDEEKKDPVSGNVDVVSEQPANGDADDIPNVSDEGAEAVVDEQMEVAEEPPKTNDENLVVDVDAIDRFFESLCAFTEGKHVAELELQHFEVWKVVHGFASEFDRGEMVSQLHQLLR